MADTYRGLTIRIGADMSELKQALKASDRAINQTQQQLNKLNRAAKINPDDLGVFSARMGAISDKAQALTAKLTELRKSNAMRNLAVDTQDAAIKAQYALREYADLCDQIKRLKNDAALSVKINPFIDGDPFKGIEGIKDTLDKMDELGIGDKFKNDYIKLAKLHEKAMDKLDYSKAVKEVAEYKNNLAVTEAEAKQLYAEMARLMTLHPAVTQTAEFVRFRAEMTRAEADAKELRSTVSKLDQALDMDPGNVDAARIKMEAMAEQVRLNAVSMGRLNEQLDEMRKKGIDKIASQFEDLKQEVANAENNVAELTREAMKARDKLNQLAAAPGLDKRRKEWRDASKDVAMWEKRLDSARASLEELTAAQTFRNLSTQQAVLASGTASLVRQMQDAGDAANVTRGAMQQLGWSLYSTLTPAFMMLGSSAIQSADDIDAAYRDMRKTVQGTEEQFEGLKQAALDFSRTHVTSADKLLEIEAMGGQLGVATSKLESFAETVSNLEIATNLDADTAAEQLGQLSAILNDMTQDDFAKFGDALVRLGNNNATLEDKIMDVTLRIASMGTITGFSTTELLAWATAVAATGQGAEASGTAISKTMSDIETAVGKGGDSLAAFAEVAGMSSEQFFDAWNNDPSSAMQAFIQGLKDIEANGGSADSTLGQLGITSVRQKQAILGLMQTIGGLNDNLTMASDAWNGVSDEWGEAGDAAREAQRKAEGFSGALQILKNNFQALSSEMGEQIAPAVIALGDLVSAMTQAYSDAPEFVKNLANMGIAAGALAGPVLVGTNAVRSAWGDMMKGFEKSHSAWAVQVNGTKGFVAELENTILASRGVVDSNGVLKKSYKDLSKQQKLAVTGTRLLSGALRAIPGVLAIGILTDMVGKVYEYAKQAELASEATDGLREALAASSADYSLAAESADATYKSVSDLVKESNELTEKQAELARSIKDTWESIGTDSALADRYVATIEELSSKSRLSVDEQARLKTAVAGLNEVTGQTYEVVNAATGEISASTKEIRENTEAWKENARYQAAYEFIVDLERQRLELDKKRLELNKKLNEEQAKGGFYTLDQDYWDIVKELEDTEDEYNAVTESIEHYTDVVEESSVASDETADSMDGLATSAEDAAALIADSMETLIEELSEELGKDGALARMFNESGLTVEQLAWKMDQAGVSASDLASACEAANQRTANAFDKIETVTDVSLQTMIDTLTHNIETTRAWKDNLATLYSQAGEATRPFLDYMASLGPEYAPIVQALVNDTSGMMEQLSALFNDAGIVADQAAFVSTFGATADAVAADYDAMLSNVAASIEKSIPYTEEQMAAWNQALYDAAYNEGYNPLKSVYEQYDADLRAAMDESVPKVEEKALDVTEAAYSAKNRYNAYHGGYAVGVDFGKGYIGGIGAMTLAILEAGAGAADAALRGAKEKQDSNSPSKEAAKLGSYFGQGFAEGIDSEAVAAAKAAKGMVEGAMDAAQKAIGPDGVSMQANIAGGFAAERAAYQNVSNRTTTTTNNYWSFDGASVNSNSEIEGAFYNFMSELKRLGVMQGGR